jgi:hypothetical protein
MKIPDTPYGFDNVRFLFAPFPRVCILFIPYGEFRFFYIHFLQYFNRYAVSHSFDNSLSTILKPLRGIFIILIEVIRILTLPVGHTVL